MYADEHDRAPIIYAFEVQAEDGRRYEVLVHEDGLAHRVPVAEGIDEDVELRRAS